MKTFHLVTVLLSCRFMYILCSLTVRFLQTSNKKQKTFKEIISA